jgi:hypothetical protein
MQESLEGELLEYLERIFDGIELESAEKSPKHFHFRADGLKCFLPT